MSIGVNRAVAIAAATDPPELRSSYERAVSHGAANTLCTREEERAHGTLGAAHAGDAAVAGPLSVRLPAGGARWGLFGRVARPIVTSRFSGIAAGALRPAHRALETHAHGLGHEPEMWVERALDCARVQLSVDLERGERPRVDRVRHRAIALTGVIAATAAKAMLVPSELADVLARLLAMYLIATTL